jgi:hypothetical protein
MSQTVLERNIEGFMFHDVDNCLKADASLLVAVALTAYTDFLGGLITGKTERGHAKENFTCFLEKMGYKESDAIRYYDLVRNGLTHEYLVKGSWQVGTGLSNRKGIEERDGHIFFDVAIYYSELKRAYFSHKKEFKPVESRLLQRNYTLSLSHTD